MLGIVALTPSQANAKAEDEYCAGLYNLASTIMDARQSDVPLPDVLKIVKGNEISTLLVKQAYSKDQMVTDEYKQRSIKRFAEETFAMCTEA
jgi:DNA polymerase elongation subunit (family B)